MIKYMLSRVIHEKSFIISRQDFLSELLIQEEHARAALFLAEPKGAMVMGQKLSKMWDV